MRCPHCGNETNDKFCENCGTQLVQNNSQKSENGSDSFNQTQQQSYDSYDQPSNSKKTEMIIISVIGGLALLMLVVIIAIICKFFSVFSDFGEEQNDNVLNEESSTSQQVDYNDYDDYNDNESPVYNYDNTYIDDDGNYVDKTTHFKFKESEKYDGWMITGYDSDYINSSSGLFTLKIPEKINGTNVVEIKDLMIYQPETPLKVVIPKTVKIVDMFALSFSDDIYAVEIADGVKTLERNSFISLSNLRSITIPDSVTKMDDCGLGIDTDESYSKRVMENFTIYCKKDSAAEAYANEYGIEYKIIN